MDGASSPIRVLTVGDGDCSFSLALARAYGGRITLTVTTLPSEQELNDTYRQFAANASALRLLGVSIIFGVDATAIPSELGLQDHICFLHPHLGLSDLLDEAAHARRHSVLIAHYLSSAKRLLTPGVGCIHLTLCGNQPRTWECESHAKRLELAIVKQEPTSYHASFFPPGARVLDPEAAVREEWGARRKFRSGALGSKHWAGRFGYEHRRCENDDDMRVEQSVEMLFMPLDADEDGRRPHAADEDVVVVDGRCAVCGIEIAPGADPTDHVKTLAMPTLTPQERAWRDESTGRTFRTQFELESFRKQQEHQLRRRPDSGAVSEAAKVASAAKAAASASAAAQAAAMIANGGDTTSDGAANFSRLSHTVPDEGDGQRAMAWVRRGAFPSQLASKSQALQAFKENRVLLGGTPVEQTRLLKVGEILELLHDPIAAHRMRSAGHASAPVVLHRVEDEVAVVWSSGMRRAGDYPGTLQSALRTLLPASAEPCAPADAHPLVAPSPISRVEPNCPGLALVARTRRKLSELGELSSRSCVVHSFVAIVIGRLPESWAEAATTLELPSKVSKGFRRAKRAARTAGAASAAASATAAAASGDGSTPAAFGEAHMESEEGQEEGEEDNDEGDDDDDAFGAAGCTDAAGGSLPGGGDGTSLGGPLLKAEPVQATRLSVTDEGLPFALSTVRLECTGRNGRISGDLCYLMRSLGYPVVGDRYAKRESASLPRYCASLKAKLQMGCFAIKLLTGEGAPSFVCECAVPSRLMAASWSSQEAAARAKLEGASHEVKLVS